MPDNPHPHPPELTQEVQTLLILLAHYLAHRIPIVASSRGVTVGATRATAFNYVIPPDP